MASTAIQNAGKKAVGQKNVPTPPADFKSEILGNLTIEEFKEEFGIGSFQVVEGPNGRFMSSKGKSIGAVGKDTDLEEELQIIELKTEKGNIYVLCNRGNGGDYAVVKTL